MLSMILKAFLREDMADKPKGGMSIGNSCFWLTWNVNSMKQGKSDMVKQEMARVNIDILGISELKWRGGTGKFNSDDHYIY